MATLVSDLISAHHFMYLGFCSVVFDNNIFVLFCGLEDLSADTSHDQFESDQKVAHGTKNPLSFTPGT